MSFSRQLVVLVGGKGTRLGELSRNTPKPMMSITDDKLFLDYFLDSAARQGFQDIVLIAGHLGDQVASRYNHTRFRESNVSVLIEPEPMGMGGGFVFAKDHLAATFVAANGDTLFDTNIRAIDSALHKNPSLQAVLALRHVEDAGRYGSVDMDDEGRIVRFREKDVDSVGVPGYINGGIYAFRRAAIEELSTLPASVEMDLFPVLAAKERLGGVSASGYFLDIGLPETLAIARDELPCRKRAALFLDRDGVLNVDTGYVHKPELFQWVDGAVDAIRAANNKGLAVVVVTNQAGVGRGYYSESDVWRLHAYMQGYLHENGAFIDKFYYSPYHSDSILPGYQITNPICRKPNSTMILRAARQLDLELSQSLMVGDQSTDISAANLAGVRSIKFDGGNLFESIRSFIEQ